MRLGDKDPIPYSAFGRCATIFQELRKECSQVREEIAVIGRTSSKENKEIKALRSLVSVPTRFETVNHEIGSNEAITLVKVAEHPVHHSPIAFGVQVEDKPSKSES